MDNMTIFWICILLFLLFVGVLLRVYDIMSKKNGEKRYRTHHRKKDRRKRNMSIGKISDYIVEREKICERCGRESDKSLCDECRSQADYHYRR